jgi:hypothetical protein
VTQGERRGGPGDHRVLLGGADIAASNMPAEMPTPFRPSWCSNPSSDGRWIGQLHRP